MVKPEKANSDIEPCAYRVSDACRLLGISRSTVYVLAAKGAIRLVRIAGRTLVPASEIARLVKEGAE